MKQLYYSMQALNQYVPANECAPSFVNTSDGSSVTDTYVYYINDAQVSGELVFNNTSAASVIVQSAMSINAYQQDYVSTFDGLTSTVTSLTAGTSQNGYSVVVNKSGTDYIVGAMSGGINQWCLDDTKAQKILDNIDQLCGCPCSDCDDILIDTIPKYIN